MTIKKSTTVKKAPKAPALKVKSAVKAGGLSSVNHSPSALKVKSAVKAGGLAGVNHNASALAL